MTHHMKPEPDPRMQRILASLVSPQRGMGGGPVMMPDIENNVRPLGPVGELAARGEIRDPAQLAAFDRLRKFNAERAKANVGPALAAGALDAGQFLPQMLGDVGTSMFNFADPNQATTPSPLMSLFGAGPRVQQMMEQNSALTGFDPEAAGAGMLRGGASMLPVSPEMVIPLIAKMGRAGRGMLRGPEGERLFGGMPSPSELVDRLPPEKRTDLGDVGYIGPDKEPAGPVRQTMSPSELVSRLPAEKQREMGVFPLEVKPVETDAVYGGLGKKEGVYEVTATNTKNEPVTFLVGEREKQMLDRLMPEVTPEEMQLLNSKDRIVDTYRAFRESDRFIDENVAAAIAGRAKRGWYRASARAITRYFGEDAGRFASLLASFSPQTSVEMNMENALSIWDEWIRAGRPKDQEAVRRVMERGVRVGDPRNMPRDRLKQMLDNANKPEAKARFGDWKEPPGARKDLASMREAVANMPAEMRQSVALMEAWRNNGWRSLIVDNPVQEMLSGPKVDSFKRNLLESLSDAQTKKTGFHSPTELTLDTYMARTLRWLQSRLGGMKNKPGDVFGTVGGKGPDYIGASAAFRRASKKLSELTGEQWTPEEVQETIWSTMKALDEKANYNPELLTDEMIAGTVDFDRLFQQYAAEGKLPETIRAPKGQPVAMTGSKAEMTPAMRQSLAKLASETQAFKAEGNARLVMNREQVPGAAGVLPKLAGRNQPTREAFSEATRGIDEVTGRSTIPDAVMGELNIERAAQGTGVYTEGRTTQFNPMVADRVDLPLKGGQILPEHELRAQLAGGTEALVQGQNMVGHHYLSPKAPQTGVLLKGAKGFKMDEAGMKALEAEWRKLTPGGGAVIQRGDGSFYLMNFDPNADPAALKELLKKASPRFSKLVGGGKVEQAGHFGSPMDLSEAWQAGEGSGAVTRQVLAKADELEAAAPGTMARVEEGMREPHVGADIMARSEAMQAAATKQGGMRPDLVNAQRILAEGGFAALRAALLKGVVALPAFLLAVKSAGGSATPTGGASGAQAAQ